MNVAERFQSWSRPKKIAVGAVSAVLVLAAIGSAGADEGKGKGTKEASIETTDVEQTTTSERIVTTTTERPTTTTEATTTTTSTTTTTAPPTTTIPPTTAPPPPPPTTAPPPPPPPPEPQPFVDSGGGCDPNYSGCVPIDSDVDCAGGSGNGPSYTGQVQVIGTDIYGLDADNDGTGCE